MSHNDAATIDPFLMMVLMYHLTGDKKYVANLHKLGPFIERTNLGEGDVVGWCEGYDDNGRPLRARQYAGRCGPGSMSSRSPIRRR
jgi:hypothetical protein